MAFLFKKVETFLLGKDLRPDEEQFKIDSAARFALLVRAVRGIRLVRVWCVCTCTSPLVGHTVWHAGLQSSLPAPCVLQKRLKPLVREVLKRVADSSMVRRTWPAC